MTKKDNYSNVEWHDSPQLKMLADRDHIRCKGKEKAYKSFMKFHDYDISGKDKITLEIDEYDPESDNDRVYEIKNGRYSKFYLLQIAEEIEGKKILKKTDNQPLKRKRGTKITLSVRYGLNQTPYDTRPLLIEGNDGYIYGLAPRIVENDDYGKRTWDGE